MRVLHVVRQFFPCVGGLESFVLELARQQRRDGIRAEVLTLDRSFTDSAARLPESEIISGIPVHRIGFFGPRFYPVAPGVLKRVKDFDLVHVHAIDFFIDFLALTWRLHKRPIVVSTHGGFFHTNRFSTLKRIYFRLVTRASLKCCRMVIASSAHDEAIFTRIGGQRVQLIENGVDTAKFADAGPQEFCPTLLYFGRLSQNKGLDRLLEAFDQVVAVRPRATLAIAGNDYDGVLADLQKRVRAMRHGHAVSIHTGLDDSALRRLLARSAVFVSASRYEGFGISVIEAMSAGLVPVLSQIPTFDAIVARSGVGWTIDFGKPEVAGEALANALDTAERHYPSLRAKALAASRAYDWSGVARRFAKAYETVNGSKRRTLLGVDISALDRTGVVQRLDAALDPSGWPTSVAFANANLLNIASRDAEIRALLSSFMVLNDGVGVDIASRLKYGRAFDDNLNGTDFVPFFLEHTRKDLRIYLIGSSNDVIYSAARAVAMNWRRHRVVGWRSGYFLRPQSAAAAAEAIRRSGADVVLVGMGNPLQERWIAEYGAATGAKVLIGVGALFDFMSGSVARAPEWMRQARLEWLYRLACEPRRLAGRYLIGVPAFLARARSDRNSFPAIT